MDAERLRELQTPLKKKYRDEPQAAMLTLHAEGELDLDGIGCRIVSGKPHKNAGLHPATGGDGSGACSGDMLLEALAACAGVTLCAVASAMELPIRGGRVRVEGDLDFRGTLGVDKQAAVGFTAIRLSFELDSSASEAQLDSLLGLTERYCVVFQTLSARPELSASVSGRS